MFMPIPTLTDILGLKMGTNVNAITLSIVFVAFVGPVELSCPDSWLEHGNSCYYFSSIRSDWNNSMEYCQNQGGYLAEIEDSDENDFLKNESLRLLPVHPYGYWIGGMGTTHHTWIWMNSGHHFSYTNWNPREPNSIKEHCVELRKDFSYNWNNWGCSISQGFICEKSLQESGLEPLVPPGLG